MADCANSTRRDFLRALPATAASLALLPTASALASESRVSNCDTAPELPSPEKASRALMMVGSRLVTIDTEDLPKTYVVHHEDQGAGAWVDRVSMPDFDAEYVVLIQPGEIVVTRLTDGYSEYTGPDRRKGWIEVKSSRPDYRLKSPVTVLGKVVQS